MSRRSADVAAILDGTLARQEALWQLGRELLGHTNDMLAIRNGEDQHGGDGCRSTDTDAWLWYHPTKGVWIEQLSWRPPATAEEHRIADVMRDHGDDDARVPDRQVVWRTRWGPVVALVQSILADASSPLWAHLVAEIIDAAEQRLAEVESWPPSWVGLSDPRNAPAEREARTLRWGEIEDRCHAAAAAVWDAARPDQGTLW